MKRICGNSIGETNQDVVQFCVPLLSQQWSQTKESTPSSWWSNSELRKKAVQFFLDSIDVLVKHVDDIMQSGPDKKATVLYILAALYDLIIQDILPLWLKPFAAGLKTLIIYTLFSLLIDFMVNKYHNGVWKKGGSDAQTQPHSPAT